MRQCAYLVVDLSADVDRSVRRRLDDGAEVGDGHEVGHRISDGSGLDRCHEVRHGSGNGVLDRLRLQRKSVRIGGPRSQLLELTLSMISVLM